MKLKGLLLAGIVLSLCISTVAWSTPYVGADIEKIGRDYSKISKLGATVVSGDRKWYVEDDSIWTAWGGVDMWIEYTADLTVGTWNIGLNAINHGYLGTGWYAAFNISSEGLGSTETIVIPASDKDEFFEFTTVDIDVNGEYTVKYTWLNDAYASPLDANIEITSVFFDDVATAPVPEPATMMLFGIGLLGLAGISRRKQK